MKLIKYLLAFLLASNFIFPQQNLEKQLRGVYKPEEMVTLSASISFNQAVELLSKVSEKSTGRKIVSTVISSNPIGIEITRMPYDKALITLVQYSGLMYETKEDIIIIKRKNEIDKKVVTDSYAPPESREVNISAVFFELDVNTSKQRGIDWRWLLQGKGLNIGSNMGLDKTLTSEALANSQLGSTGQTTTGTSTSTTTQSTTFGVNGTASWNGGGFYGQAAALFQFFENEGLGNTIASPNITVRDGKEGKIQVGTDFSIKQKDFSGNVIDNFYSTGSIIKVTPFVHNEDSLQYMLLNISVERSSFVPDPTTTQIKKTSASTQVVLLNGEETTIGGLYSNEETKTRAGVPILKDLPWWVFGLRYIFGTEEIIVNKKELIILIKAELVPTMKERNSKEWSKQPIKDAVLKNENNIKYYQFRPDPEVEKPEKDSTDNNSGKKD